MRHFPEGFGIPLPSGSVDLDATFQDLRQNRSALLTVWWENAFKFAAHMRTSILPFYTFNLWTRTPKLVPTYLLHQRSRVGIHWYMFTMPISGRYVWYYYHTHHHWVSDILTFSAAPKQLGLDGLWPKRPPWEIQYVYDTSLFSSMKQNLTMSLIAVKKVCASSRMCPQVPRLVCQLAPFRERWEFVDDGASPPSFYERFAPAVCVPWVFHVGDTVTVVSFMEPMFAGLHLAGVERLHVFTRGLIIPDNKAQAGAVNIVAELTNLTLSKG